MNEKQQIFEVINGFKNLTSKIKKDNDDIKVLMKNKDTTIAACKKEYKKLYAEHEELKQKYVELEMYIQKQKQQQQQQQQQFTKKRKNQFQEKQKRKHYIIDDHEDDDNDDNNNDDDDNDNDDDDFEIIKIKKNKKNSKISKGILDYINNNNN